MTNNAVCHIRGDVLCSYPPKMKISENDEYKLENGIVNKLDS